MSCARERRKISSCARLPKVATASGHRARASTCGHSSSQASLVVPARSLRSCATIASCQAVRRALRSAASCVPMPELRTVYGFMSQPSSLAIHDDLPPGKHLKTPLPAAPGPRWSGPVHAHGRAQNERAKLGSNRTGGVGAVLRRRTPRRPKKPVARVRAGDTPVAEAGTDGG